MSGWIKFDKDMAEDPRLIQAAESLVGKYVMARVVGMGGSDLSRSDALRFASNALRGALVTLWCYADTHIRDDDRLPLTSQTLDALVGLDDFCEVMSATGWIGVLDDGTVKLTGYCAKNSLIAKRKRAENNKTRQAAFRARHNFKANGIHNASVTRYSTVTSCVDQDQDLKKRSLPSGGKESPSKARAATATRLPGDWTLTTERRAVAAAEQADAEREFQNFTDHWLSASGAKARKHDWDATWRIWCRRAADFKPRGTGQRIEPAKRSSDWSRGLEGVDAHK